MQDRFNAARRQGDYRSAAQVIRAWQRQAPQDPWLALAIAQYHEGTGRWEAALQAYRRILQESPQAKILTQARQGIQRVQDNQAQQWEAAKAAAKAQPGSEAPGLLCLEPVAPQQRTTVAQALAQVLQIDAYTARLQLPGKEWRLYRLGSIGELQYLGQTLRQAQAPTFWVKHEDLKAIPVFRVDYFRALTPQPTVVCQNAQGQLGEIRFDWSEVSQGVFGYIPLFESVVDRGPWGKWERKEKTQDYAEVFDLHCPGRRCILRLCDRTYQFRQSYPLGLIAPDSERDPSARPRWNTLLTHLRQQIPGPTHTEFTAFGSGALEFIPLLPPMAHHLSLNRSKDSPWDSAFHLYSALHFWRSRDRAVAVS